MTADLSSLSRVDGPVALSPVERGGVLYTARLGCAGISGGTALRVVLSGRKCRRNIKGINWPAGTVGPTAQSVGRDPL